MDRGYWLPPGYRKMAAYGGYYIQADAVYTSADIDADWDAFLKKCCAALLYSIPSMQKVCKWVTDGTSRFVLTADALVEIIAEDNEDYVAVYAIVPVSCAKPKAAKRHFSAVEKKLKHALCSVYPGQIWQRLNSQHIRRVRE